MRNESEIENAANHMRSALDRIRRLRGNPKKASVMLHALSALLWALGQDSPTEILVRKAIESNSDRN